MKKKVNVSPASKTLMVRSRDHPSVHIFVHLSYLFVIIDSSTYSD